MASVPAVIALILHSCWRLGKLGMEDASSGWWPPCRLVVTVVVQAEVAILFIGAGVLGILWYGTLFRRRRNYADLVDAAGCRRDRRRHAPSLPVLGKLLAVLPEGRLAYVRQRTGHRAVPRERTGAGDRLARSPRVPVAVAIGMLSPGPVVITATFVGYLVAGFWGSLVSTIGIFLPSFILVLVVAPILIEAPCERQCAGLREGRLRGGDRHDPGRLRPAWADRDWRLAHRPDRDLCRSPCCSASR